MTKAVFGNEAKHAPPTPSKLQAHQVPHVPTVAELIRVDPKVGQVVCDDKRELFHRYIFGGAWVSKGVSLRNVFAGPEVVMRGDVIVSRESRSERLGLEPEGFGEIIEIGGSTMITGPVQVTGTSYISNAVISGMFGRQLTLNDVAVRGKDGGSRIGVMGWGELNGGKTGSLGIALRIGSRTIVYDTACKGFIVISGEGYIGGTRPDPE
jgi:hypothetical protein